MLLKNRADSRGGGLFVDKKGELIAKSTTMMENYAEGEGGALYMGWGSTSIMSGCRFGSNSARASGGAIFTTSKKGLFLLGTNINVPKKQPPVRPIYDCVNTNGASKDCGDESCAKNGYRCYCGLTTKEDPFIRSNPLEAANGRLICDQWTYCSEQKNAEEDPESALFNTDESFCFRSFKSNRRLLQEVVGVETLVDSRGASVTSVTGVTSVTSDTAKASGGTDSLDDVYGGIKRRSTLMEIQEMQDIQETVMQEAKETKENTKENEIQSKQSSSSSSSSSSHSMSRTSRRTNALVDSITNPNGQWVQTDDNKHRFVYNQDLFVDQVNTWKAEGNLSYDLNPAKISISFERSYLESWKLENDDPDEANVYIEKSAGRCDDLKDSNYVNNRTLCLMGAQKLGWIKPTDPQFDAAFDESGKMKAQEYSTNSEYWTTAKENWNLDQNPYPIPGCHQDTNGLVWFNDPNVTAYYSNQDTTLTRIKLGFVKAKYRVMGRQSKKYIEPKTFDAPGGWRGGLCSDEAKCMCLLDHDDDNLFINHGYSSKVKLGAPMRYDSSTGRHDQTLLSDCMFWNNTVGKNREIHVFFLLCCWLLLFSYFFFLFPFSLSFFSFFFLFLFSLAFLFSLSIFCSFSI